MVCRVTRDNKSSQVKSASYTRAATRNLRSSVCNKELLRDTDQTAPPRPWPAPNWPPDSGSSWLDMLGRRRSPRGIKPYLNELREAKRSEKKRCSLLRKDAELLRGMDGSDVGIAELTTALEEAEARLAHITGLIAELEQPSPSGPGTWLKVSWSNASNQSSTAANTHTYTHERVCSKGSLLRC